MSLSHAATLIYQLAKNSWLMNLLTAFKINTYFIFNVKWDVFQSGQTVINRKAKENAANDLLFKYDFLKSETNGDMEIADFKFVICLI